MARTDTINRRLSVFSPIKYAVEAIAPLAPVDVGAEEDLAGVAVNATANRRSAATSILLV